MKPTILHVITDLGPGGAERMLGRLVLAATSFRHVVVSLAEEKPLSATLRSSGIEVYGLGMRRGMPSLMAVLRLIRIISRNRPALVQTWLYHADFIGLIAARLASCRTVAWNLRCSNMDLSRYRWSTRFVVRLLARLSSRPSIVLVNSEAGRDWHLRLGFHPREWAVVPNGIDTTLFRPNQHTRKIWRDRLGISAETVLVGAVARRDPMKDHETMLAAAAIAARAHPHIAFVFAGSGVTRDDPQLARLADTVSAPVHFMGECSDVPALMAALDVAVLPSAFGEGFSNVIGEAMATEVPCVATDVGDSASIIGSTGYVVPPRNPRALASAIGELVADPALRGQLGAAARHRIEEFYSLPVAVHYYETLWRSLIANAAPRASVQGG
jgi:glycosyltransferase involved in cell wall biosynthesis